MEFSKVLAVLCLVGFAGATRCVQQQCPKTGFAILPLVTDCSAYILCKEGIATTGSCSYNLHFDASLQACVPKAHTTCTLCKYPTLAKRVPVPRLIEAISPNNISERCKQNSVTPVQCTPPLGDDRLLPHPDDCELFYYCVTTELSPICRDCPDGLHFNPIKHVCDHPSVAGCVGAGSARSIQPRENIRCRDKNGQWADIRPSTKDCNKYYVCNWGHPIAMYCPPDLHFNPTKKVCDFPEKARCKATGKK